MASLKRKILVTSALPYANGPIHLGHLVEYIQTDIWVRFQKSCKNHCLYVCADDAHGTPIMLRAQQESITPEDLIKKTQDEHEKDFSDFLIEFDNYHSTHSKENQSISNNIYEALSSAGHIRKKIISQFYDEKAEMFLPDRFIKGECPHCNASDQYGDACEECGATYSPTDLKDPRSTLTGATPITKESEHYFFLLNNFQKSLKNFVDNKITQTEMRNKLQEWFDSGLRDWDISRDEPYFGFEIPGEIGKYFYVWFDAPIGYIASFLNLCNNKKYNFDEYWAKNSEAELYHFIGKDIAYFHTLFWPALLEGSGYRLPTNIFYHGFLTINGKKMSKSRGTYITARTYIKHLEPEYLRYYFAAKLGADIEDIDLNLDDFIARINSDLVGKFANIASRCASFINKDFKGELSEEIDNQPLFDEFCNTKDLIAKYFEDREYSAAIKQIMKLADSANQYINDKEPWKLAKLEGKEKDVQAVCSMGINLFRVLTIYLKPIMPNIAKTTENFLQTEPLYWSDIEKPLLKHKIKEYTPLVERLDKKNVAKIISN